MFPGLQVFPEGQIIGFALVLLRIIAFVFTWPIFGSQQVPIPLRVLLSVALSVVVFPLVKFDQVNLVKIDDAIIMLSIREIVIGLILGFLMRMIFMAVEVSGEMISLSLGLSASQVFNPSLGHATNIMDQFQTLLASLFFLAINGHHFFIIGMAESFHLAPVATLGIKTDQFIQIVPVATQVILIGLKISAPIIAAILVANVAMGVVGRAVPQINVLVTSMPITFLGGLFILILMIPYFLTEVNFVSEFMATQFFNFLKVM